MEEQVSEESEVNTTILPTLPSHFQNTMLTTEQEEKYQEGKAMKT